MTQPSNGHKYSTCPGVPALQYVCTRRVKTRERCEDCERMIQTGKVTPRIKRCPGVPETGRTCTHRVRTRVRCRLCEVAYDTYLDHLAKKTPKIRIERWCLGCSKKFIAKNRFVRLCKLCKENNRSNERGGYDDTRYAISFGRYAR